MLHDFGRARAIGLALVVSTAFISAPALADDAVAASPAAPAPTPAVEDDAAAAVPTPPASAEPATDAPAEAPVDLSAIADAPSEEASAPAQEKGGGIAPDSGVHLKLICTNCNAASLWVNGLSGDHVRLWMDGMPTVSGLGTVYTLSQWPSDFVAYTHVTHGPGSVLSGSAAIGGTIEYHSSERTTERKALLDVGFADDAYHGLRVAGSDRWGPVGALVYLQAAESNNVDANADGWPEIAEYERFTEQGIFDFHLTDHQVLTVDVLSYGEDQHEGPGAPVVDPEGDGAPSPELPPVGPPPSLTWDREDEATFFNMQQYALRYENHQPSGLNLYFGGRYSRRGQQQWQAPDYEPEENKWTFFIEDEQTAGRFQAEVPVGKALVTTGIGWSHLNLQVRQKLVTPGQPGFLIDNLDQSEIWAEYWRSLGSKWDFSAGVRGDRFEVYGRHVAHIRFPPPEHDVAADDPKLTYDRFEPRTQAHWRPNEKVTVELAVGKGALGPTPAFSETCCGAKYQRNLKLLPEDSWAYQAGVEVHPTRDMRIAARLFRTDFENYQQKVVYKSEAYVAYYTRRNIPRARIQGIDILHDMRFKDDRYDVGWTYTYTEHEGSEVHAMNDAEEIELDPSGNPYVVSEDGAPLAFIPKHAASAYFRYKRPDKGTSINFSWTYQGSLKHYQLNWIRRFTDPWDLRESESYWTADVDFEQRIGHAGWAAYGGVRNINDYVQGDLGDIDRIYDWGPIQGRTVFAGMKFSK